MRPLSLLTRTCASLRLTYCPINVSVHVLPTAAFSAPCCTYVTVTPRPAPREPDILLYLCTSLPRAQPHANQTSCCTYVTVTPRPAPREPDILLDMQIADPVRCFVAVYIPTASDALFLSPSVVSHCWCTGAHCWCTLLVHTAGALVAAATGQF